MKDWIGTVLIALIVVGLPWLIWEASIQHCRTKRDFAEACTKINGTTIWTGRHWECLK